MVTRADVAARAGVSTAVVSYVLNDGPRPVAAATKERVLAAMKELGYRPNVVARALRMRRTHTFGLVVPDNSNPFFAELARAVEDAAFEHGYALLLGNATEDVAREASYIKTFLERQIDALLLVAVQSLPDLRLVLEAGTPLVVLDRPMPDVPVPTVLVDNEGGALLATRHLIDHGHHRIGCLTGPTEVAVASERRNGYRRAMHEADLRVPGTFEVSAPFSRQGGYLAAHSMLNTGDRPSALFAGSDMHAIGTMRAAAELGLRIPHDLAIISFDDTEEARFTTPGLTAIHQPTELIARRAVNCLLDMLAGKEPPANEILPVALHRRGSCGCPDTPPNH